MFDLIIFIGKILIFHLKEKQLVLGSCRNFFLIGKLDGNLFTNDNL